MDFALTEEQQMVKDQVTRFAETEIKPIAAELDRTHRHPEEICRKLGEMGIMGVSVDTEYGGAGMDNVTYVLALIAIAKACEHSCARPSKASRFSGAMATAKSIRRRGTCGMPRSARYTKERMKS